MKRGRNVIKIPTWAIAGVVGKSEPAVRRDARMGVFDRRDLGSVIRYAERERK